MMMTEMLAREGVYLAKFDFCQVGMEVSSGRGKKASAGQREEAHVTHDELQASRGDT